MRTIAAASVAFGALANDLTQRLRVFEASQQAHLTSVKEVFAGMRQEQARELESSAAAVEGRIRVLAAVRTALLSATEDLDAHGERFRQLVNEARSELVTKLVERGSESAKAQRLHANEILQGLTKQAQEVSLAESEQ